MKFELYCIAVILPLLSCEARAQSSAPLPTDRILPVVERGQKLDDITQRFDEYFASIGYGRGTGFRQYMRWQDFAASRSTPSGELLNTTAMTLLNQHRTIQPTAAASSGLLGGANWRSVGPTKAAVEREGGDIGRINAIAFHPTDGGTIYAGTPAGGLWRTKDDGVTWSSVTDGLGLIGIQDIVLDPQAPETIYILTGDGDGKDTTSIGVLKSTDEGRTWRDTGLIWKVNEVEYGYRLVIDPTNPQTLLAATTAGLLRTTDRGAKWTPVLVGDRLKDDIVSDTNNPIFDVQFHPSNPSIVYAASMTNVYRSSDAGATWTQLSGGLPDFQASKRALKSNRIRLAVTPHSPNTLYVLYGAPGGFWIGLFRSDDSGNTFSQRSSSNPPPENTNYPTPFDQTKTNILGRDANDFESQSYYDLAMAVAPDNVDRVHVGGIDTYRSDDGGLTWQMTSKWNTPSRDNYTHADIHVLSYRGRTLYAGTDGGVFRSMDAGNNWISIASMTTGMGIALIYALCATPQDPTLLYYGAQDNGTWRLQLDGEIRQVLGGDGFVCHVNPKNSRIVYGSVQNGDIQKSEDGGQNFRDITPTAGSPPRKIRGPWLTPYVLSPEDPNTIYACYTDLWRGEEPGPSWKNLTNGVLGNSLQCKQVAVAPSEPNTIYVAKSGALRDSDRSGRSPFFGGGGVFRSTDAGASWQTVTNNLPLSDATLVNMAVSPTDARRAWVTFSGYSPGIKIFETKDGGATWTNISAGLPNLPVQAIAAQNVPTQRIFIGTDNGVYYRDDSLGRWERFMGGMPPLIVSSLLIDETQHRIFAATFGRGVWLSDIPAPCTDNCAPQIVPGMALLSRPVNAPAPPAAYVGRLDIFE
jgi:photosystem II stability/assembly factor-like uncharacterized protein